MHDGEQQRRVGAGPRRDVPVGQLGGAGARRVDHRQPAAALAQRLELAAEVGGGGQAAVGHQRVRADDDEVVGAVEVGHRERHRVAEHQPSATCLGIWSSVLAEYTCRVPRPRMISGTYSEPAMVCAFGLPAYTATDEPPCSAEHGAESRRDRREGLVPADLDQFAVPANQRTGQPVRIAVEFAETRALRADEARAEDVVAVTAGARSPGARCRRLSSVRPQVASQNGQIRSAVRVSTMPCIVRRER